MPKMQFQHNPLVKWPRKPTEGDKLKSGQFKARFDRTLQMLASELSRLGAINPVMITTDHQGRNDIRIDGLPREDVRIRSHGVVIEFYALPHGRDGERQQMQFACDTYRKWQHNLHAIALTLESLRAIDRYGATSAGEQYAGFKALPAPPEAMTVQATANAFAGIKDVGVTAKMIIDSKQIYQDTYRIVAKRSHPDAGGNPDLWKVVQTADSILRAHHRL